MKVAILIFLCILSTSAFALCLPNTENKLLHLNSETVQMEHSAQKFENVVLKVLPAEIEFSVMFQSLNPRINAEITKSNNIVMIEIMGGMLGHPRLNENAFRMLLCHELGHFLGGEPLKSRGGWSSTEGQADYFSGSTCPRMLGMDENSVLDGSLRLTSIYAEVMREPIPRMDRCDQTRVPRTNYGYPKVQCRLDTIIAGWRAEQRPSCWFLE